MNKQTYEKNNITNFIYSRIDFLLYRNVNNIIIGGI
nr:MAG TPA: hypothetical protein [Bacteriophage sp.]